MKKDNWEDSSCPICPDGARATHFIECGDRFNEPAKEKFRLVRCPECGLIFLNPRLSKEASEIAYREEGYDPFLSLQKPVSTFERMYSTARQFMLSWKKRLVAGLIKPGAFVLDGGCSTGEFLNILKDRYIVEGFEPESAAALWAREQFGLSVQTGDFDTATPSRNQYDLITLWHVLEHLPSPSDGLKKLHSLLSDSGKILIAVPNVASLDAKIYGKYWVPLDAPRHLWHFTPETMAKLAEKCGLRIESQGLLPLDPIYNSLLSEKMDIQANGRARIFVTPLRLPISIAGSYLYGLFTGNHSSVYYVLTAS